MMAVVVFGKDDLDPVDNADQSSPDLDIVVPLVRQLRLVSLFSAHPA